MTKKRLSGLLMGAAILIFALSACSWPQGHQQEGENIGTRSKAAVAMLSHLPPEQAKTIVYVNVNSLKNRGNIVTMERINRDVFENGKHYFIDFSDTSNSAESDNLRKYFEKIIGVDFFENWLVIGSYKGALIYSPLSSQSDPLLNIAAGRTGTPRHTPQARLSGSSFPIEAFYEDVYHRITTDNFVNDNECKFSNVWPPFWPSEEQAFKVIYCKDANISLVYRINLMRSFSSGESPTPDAKLVRISLDSESSGPGISLNPYLWHINQPSVLSSFDPNYKDGRWDTAITTSAIAKDYQFSIEGSNSKATILKTYPQYDLAVSYNNSVTSTLEVGVDAKISPTDPSLSFGTKTSLARSLSYNTQDYTVVRNSKNNSQISFTWQRDQYPTAASLLDQTANYPAGATSAYPIVESRIQPISYTGFTPNFDVVYKASPNASGHTVFTIKSSVNLWPIRSGLYYWRFSTEAGAKDEWQTYRRITAEKSIDVNWDNPVFLGRRPVNLQASRMPDTCLSAAADGKIRGEKCDLKSLSQSFIYDEKYRYMGVITKTCLDAANLITLQPCNGSLSQRWKWLPNSEHLENQQLVQQEKPILAYKFQKLFTDSLELYELHTTPPSTADSEFLGTGFISTFTDVFSSGANAGRGS